MRTIALALHGGAGTLARSLENADAAKPYRAALAQALEHGWLALDSGFSALDVVTLTVEALEDCPLFNAGRGSVLTHDSTIEMDAAVMCGRSLAAGAVAGVPSVRNPVRLARQILLDERYVLLSGEGALDYAKEHRMRLEELDYFITEERRQQLEAARASDRIILDHDKFGTVGAVALDHRGNLAAATSTGGLTNKRYSRVGDSPLIGCGTYANNRTCAVSCTGYGEAFIRAVTAHEVAARMQFGGATLEEAANAVIHGTLPAIRGEGGLVAVDAAGNVALSFNTEGMYRAWQTPTTRGVSIFNEMLV